MAIGAREAYHLRDFAKNNPGIHPQLRKFFQLIDETIMGSDSPFPTTTTTTTTSSTTSSSSTTTTTA